MIELDDWDCSNFGFARDVQRLDRNRLKGSYPVADAHMHLLKAEQSTRVMMDDSAQEGERWPGRLMFGDDMSAVDSATRERLEHAPMARHCTCLSPRVKTTMSKMWSWSRPKRQIARLVDYRMGRRPDRFALLRDVCLDALERGMRRVLSLLQGLGLGVVAVMKSAGMQVEV